MPSYMIILNVRGRETVEATFQAIDDGDAAAKFVDNIPQPLRAVQKQLSFRRSEVEPLHYYPRMARPQLGFSSYIGVPGKGPLFCMEENAQPPLPHNPSSVASSINQLTILVRNLADIFRTIEACPANMKVFGHSTRNMLLIASMEFENECKGVLKAHNYIPQAKSGRWTTNDFVRVMEPLRLGEYEVALSHYPAIPPRKPFMGWNSQAATQSLLWYDAYNYVKHDRETEFARATLESAIDSVLACAIMLAAQYRIVWNWQDQIGEFFEFKNWPAWKPEQMYTYIDNEKALEGWIPDQYAY